MKYYKKPFYSSLIEGVGVYIYDAGHTLMASFNEVTQVPLDDSEALKEEELFWKREADRIVSALNKSY